MKFNYYWPKNTLKTTKNNQKTNENSSVFNNFSTKNTNINETSKKKLENEPKNFFQMEKQKEIIATNETNIISPNSQKLKELAILRKKKMNDTSLIFANQGNNFVFEYGNPDANVMFIGEAPGEEENRQGVPFVGKSGQLLRFFLKEAKIIDFYITNIISWRPPNNRTPTNEEIFSMQLYVFEHIRIINPKIIVTVGTTALKALNIHETITKAQGNLFDTEIGKIYPIYHPSYALRVSPKKKDLWISLLKLKNYIS